LHRLDRIVVSGRNRCQGEQTIANEEQTDSGSK
jgi:hypothetical protein